MSSKKSPIIDEEIQCLVEECDDPDCFNCMDDNAEAAFWDEFLNQDAYDENYSLNLISELTGEVFSLNQLNLQPYTVVRSD